MNSFQKIASFITISLLAVLLVGCPGGGGGGGGGGDGGGGLQTPIGDLTGTWNISETASSSDPSCSGSASYSLTITQSGNTITATDARGGSFTGTISANQLSWSGSFPDGPGTTTVSSMTATVAASCNSISGNATWSYSETGFSCTGTTTFTGTRSPASGCGGGGGGSSDPLYTDQWHLNNTGQDGGTAGEDINVDTVWSSFDGTGVRIAVVDDGLEIAHEDLAANVVSGASYDYTLPGYGDPTGGAHGTAVAGVAAAVGFNGIGVRGVAPAASLVGYNLLQAGSTANEANAMTRDAASNSVNSNSWGPADGTGFLSDSSSLWRGAIDTGLATGRSGRGLIYTWAAGNGGSGTFWGRDNSNYDGYANYYGVMAIAALDDKGRKASYSEHGANLWVSTPSGEFCDTNTTTTTDRTGTAGYNANGVNGPYTDYTDDNYSQCFNGTSSATPVASGVIALMLEANPNLGWRDVRQILAQTARQNDVAGGAWTTNGAGLTHSHKYGFGVIDAQAAVTTAQSWTNLPTMATCTTSVSAAGGAIADGTSTTESNPGFGAPQTLSVTACGGVSVVEFVEVNYTGNHTYFGDLEITLISPDSGTESRLADPHLCNSDCLAGYASGWRFGSARHLGENPTGTWQLRIRDGYFGDTGTAGTFSLKIYGH
ncbi:MAG: hypothetical protein BMS9Abin36_1738 [Gammaproteobacteria bacterium]|nr:MAG: hypothetical protein BMS9Abin36_1738 [Gammaproteobacteria bacterium]